MSVKSFYYVQCSGDCNGWLGEEDGQFYVAREFEHALPFSEWSWANEGAALAGWFDGPQGEYAKCTCEADMESLHVSRTGSVATVFSQHWPQCRVMKPRLIPLCPPCRKAMCG